MISAASARHPRPSTTMMGIPAPLHKGVAGMADRKRTADARSRERIIRAKPLL
jgi:hypothetical protein